MSMILLAFLCLSFGRAAPLDGQIEFGDINLLIVTDAHSWISRHFHGDHRPPLDASFGDIASAVAHVKALAQAANKDVFFLNNGDHVEGSGLSDASVYTTGIHGYDLFPLISLMPFDALTIGNHDLYDDSTISYMKHESGFIDGWKGRYLTSNTFNATTNESIGSQYLILVGPNAGTKVLVFGFLYHMTDSCDTITVQDPKHTVRELWFQRALKEAVDEEVSAIIVLAHMDVKDPNVFVIRDAIRGYTSSIDASLATIPVQFVTGHTHYRGFIPVDAYSSSFEAGHYLDTLGWLSFNLLPAKTSSDPIKTRASDFPERQSDSRIYKETRTLNSTDPSVKFNHKYIDANRDVLMAFTGTNSSSFDTEMGLSITEAIESTVNRLGLREVLGCAPKNYSYAVSLDHPNSMYALYMDKVLPMGVFDIPTGTGNNPYYVTSTGSLRYNIYEGEMIYDDVFAIAPFANVFLFYPAISGANISLVISALNSLTSLSIPGLKMNQQEYAEAYALRFSRSKSADKMPSFIGGPDIVSPNSQYDLFYNDFDGLVVTHAIAAVLGVPQSEVLKKCVPWRQKGDDFIDTTLVWDKGIRDIWPC